MRFIFKLRHDFLLLLPTIAVYFGVGEPVWVSFGWLAFEVVVLL
jgi:hypothetical protein